MDDYIEIIKDYNELIFSNYSKKDTIVCFTSVKGFDNENHEKYKGSKFNKPVDNLPHNLTHLIFGYAFNQPIDNLPPNLTLLLYLNQHIPV